MYQFLLILDEWNPYCSKWGYCISYDAYGADGPGQSRGAVEDGTRGQCRDDSDCTPHTPTCSPEGYCSAGRFSAVTDPTVVKTDVHYAIIEDNNRFGHVESRKDDPLFQERPDLLADVEAVENTVYTPCTYCKYDPATGVASSDVFPNGAIPPAIVPLPNSIAAEEDVPYYPVEPQLQPAPETTQTYDAVNPFNIVPTPQISPDLSSNIPPTQDLSPQAAVSNEDIDPQYSFDYQDNDLPSTPQTQPVNPYTVFPAIPSSPISESIPTPAIQDEDILQPVLSISPQEDIAPQQPFEPVVYSVAPPVPQENALPTQPQQPILQTVENVVPQTNILPQFEAVTPVVESVPNVITQDNTLSPQPVEPVVQTVANVVPQTNILPQFAPLQPANIFNPFQSPQFQTGQATSIHQNRPQYPTPTAYNFPSYSFFHYPRWGANPYFHNPYFYGK